jgi:hypothetical protein
MKSKCGNELTIYNMECYNTEIDADTNEIVIKLHELLIEFMSFITENIKLKNLKIYRFIIIRGLNIVTNVFNHLLLYTKNLNLTCLYSQKAYYYYIEFISQITDDDNIFLQLTSRDTMVYVYKKTIYCIPKDIKMNISNSIHSEKTNEILNIYNLYVHLYENILIKIIHDGELNSEIITKLENLFIFTELSNYNMITIQYINDVVNNLCNKIKDVDYFIDICWFVIKYIQEIQYMNTHEELNRKIKKINNNIDLFDFHNIDKIPSNNVFEMITSNL